MSNSLEFTRLTHYPKQNPSNSCGSETQGASPRKEALNPIKKRNTKLNHSQSTPMIEKSSIQYLEALTVPIVSQSATV